MRLRFSIPEWDVACTDAIAVGARLAREGVSSGNINSSFGEHEIGFAGKPRSYSDGDLVNAETLTSHARSIDTL
jgi:hypothetical protein